MENNLGISCGDESEASNASNVVVDIAAVDSGEMTEEMESKSMLEESLISITSTECRICQSEDSVDEMEAPCRCNGTLKFAHRDCIQQWINSSYKANCEICKESYEGGYVIPVRPPLPSMFADDREPRRPYVVLTPSEMERRLNAINTEILGRSILFRILAVIAFGLYMVVTIVIAFKIVKDAFVKESCPSPPPPSLESLIATI